jgi:hypothetical protein
VIFEPQRAPFDKLRAGKGRKEKKIDHSFTNYVPAKAEIHEQNDSRIVGRRLHSAAQPQPKARRNVGSRSTRIKSELHE